MPRLRTAAPGGGRRVRAAGPGRPSAPGQPRPSSSATREGVASTGAPRVPGAAPAFRQEYLQSLVQEQDQAMRVVALGEQSREDLVGAPASRAKGEYLWSADEGLGVLFLINLPQLSEDSTYQLWLVNDSGDRVRGGGFMPQAGRPARL